MDAFFSINNKYVVSKTFDNVRSDIETITGRCKHNFSDNIAGKKLNDGSFKLVPKVTLGAVKVFGVPQNATYLIVSLKKEGNKTIIQTSARLHWAIVLVFYFWTFILIAKFFGIDTFIDATLFDMLLFTPIVCLVFAGLMMMGALSLRNRFEQLMKLRRKE
jgi:hypothetical protein